MLIRRFDDKYQFAEIFDNETGFYMRSGVVENGIDTGVDPFMASFPTLIDIGVMGHCVHGQSGMCMKSGVQCYQNGLNDASPNMKFENLKRIVDECKGKTYQFALGGRGDVDQHENFEEILRYCRSNGIVPNFTSSGLGFSEETVALCKELCGSVAISWYRQAHTARAIDMLLKAGVTTNVHYVLGNNSIDEAMNRLRDKTFPEGINAVVFLLHKPVGLGKEENVLDMDDPRVAAFFEIVETIPQSFHIGFDSCAAPGILNLSTKIDVNSFDTCEAARFSMYVTADMIALPCSFDNQDQRWGVDISNQSIAHAWDSELFEDFRSHFRNSCSGCKDRSLCLGGCPIKREIVLCRRQEKALK